MSDLFAEKVDLGEKPGAARPERKAMTLISGMLAGADSIDDTDILRSGSSEAVLGHNVMAPSTLGTFLRSFSFGHVRQLESVATEFLARAWSAGAGPKADERVTIDLDSFVGQVYGYQKQGAGFGYTKERGLHPLLATRAETGEVLGIRLRRGEANTQRGIQRFLEELIAKVRRSGRDRRNHLRWQAADCSPGPGAIRPAGASARLAISPVHHQPNREDRAGRDRASRPRGYRASHPGFESRTTGSFSLR
ncbi:MAG: transposase [Hyphomicrobiaceae bacterium]